MSITDYIANFILAHVNNWLVLIFLVSALTYQIGKEIRKYL